MIDIDAVLRDMTLEEKCACLTGEGYWKLGGCPRLGVEPLAMSDGPHGLRKQTEAADNLGLSDSDPAVSFPTASATACTFNLELVREMGEALGDEAREQDVAVLLGPGVNMKRDPLCGRNFEYFSEDPYLAGMLGAAYIEGVQSRGVGTSLKHFACNNQETNRLIVDSLVDDRALHEVYLEPFRIAVEQAKPWTIMTAYNLLNGTYCSENQWLMDDLARGEWGFAGMCVSDWGAQNNNLTSLPAGLDVVMPGVRPDYRDDVARAVREGTISEAVLDQAVRRILQVHRQHEGAAGVGVKLTRDARLAVAQKVAEEAAVLLENDGVLPLAPDGRIAVVGAFAKHPRYQGAGSSKINPVSLDTAFEALEASGASCTYAAGYDVDSGETNDELLAEAEQNARAADVAVVFVGLPDASETEGADRWGMEMPQGHSRLVERVCAANPNTVVVLQCGSPVELPWRSLPRALVLSYLSGCRGGQATANILLGRANPSGKLAETWPVSLGDAPCAGNFPARSRQAQYRESIYTGYRFYDAAGVEPAYPFGHGLSYTSFEYGDLSVSPEGEGFAVSFALRNTGTCFGKEAVQLYLAPLDPGVFKAPQCLKAFAKVGLAPGEAQRVRLEVPRRAFAHYNPESQCWDVEGGTYELRLGSSSRDIRQCAHVEVEGCPRVPDGVPAVYHHPVPGGFDEASFKELYGKPLPKVITAMRPYTVNATVGDVRTSLLGRVLHAVLRRELRMLLPRKKGMRQWFSRNAVDTPLRQLAMTGADMRLMRAVVDILNYRFIRGIRLLMGLRSKPGTAPVEPGTEGAGKRGAE